MRRRLLTSLTSDTPLPSRELGGRIRMSKTQKAPSLTAAGGFFWMLVFFAFILSDYLERTTLVSGW